MFSWKASSEVNDLLHVSLLMNGPDSLRNFRLREFRMLCLELSRRKIVEVNDLPPCVLVDEWSRFTSGLQVFRLREFMNVVLGNLPEWYGPRVTWWPDVI
jgi:hypothetical protein